MNGKLELYLISDIEPLQNRNPELLIKYIKQSLDIKKTFIEADEFDKGYRLLLNYGHCFGHALEAASDFAIPHGIGVIFGIEYSNLLSHGRGILSEREYGIMSRAVKKSLGSFKTDKVDSKAILKYLRRDKKRTGTGLSMIISEEIGKQKKIDDVTESEYFAVSQAFESAMEDYFNS